ncbi:Spermatogenesis-associated protein 31A6 [Sciurus carolinensis]|uniref:Spermatogenesis-associated protein 31A6 n=1 Tax=Sciurus carolinensis TaxID=30640 RepID=A0AA41T7A3_SCICA|nr:Spermatogenesis-associated protein 31A6 [Sciurus carolinensis]
MLRDSGNVQTGSMKATLMSHLHPSFQACRGLLALATVVVVGIAPNASLPDIDTDSLGLYYDFSDLEKCSSVPLHVLITSGALGQLMGASKEIERALTGIPPTQDHRPPATPPALQESRQPSQTLSHSLLDRTLQSRTVLGTGKSSLKAPPLPRTSAARYLGEPCLQAEDTGKFQHTVEIKVVNQPPVSAPDVSLPDCSTNTLSAADSLASLVSWSPLQSKPFGKTPVSPTVVNLLAGRRSSLMPQKPRVLKHQHLQRPQRELYAPAYRGEDRRRPSSGQHKEMEELGTCKLPQARGLEEKKQEFRFLQWLFPKKKKIKEQEEALKTCRPPSASAQSAAPVRATPSVDSNITEARELLTAVGQMLEKKMALHHKCCASKLKQPREEHPGPAPQAPCYHRPPVYPWQRGLSGYAAAHKGRSCPIRERPDRSQQSLKSVHFNSQQWGQRHPHPWLPKKAVSPVSPSSMGRQCQGPQATTVPAPGTVFTREASCLLNKQVFLQSNVPNKDDFFS